MARWPYRSGPRPGNLNGDPDEDIREELDLYLELRAQELIAEGMHPDEARREAERRFGDRRGVERKLRREARRSGNQGDGGWTMMRNLLKNVAYALRGLTRDPGFAVVVLGTLALAIAGNTVLFSVLDAAVLRALPFRDHERLVVVEGYHLQNGTRAIRSASIPEFRDWRARSRSITPMVGYDVSAVTLTDPGSGAAVGTLESVSEGYFELLGADLAPGRDFTAEEHATSDGFPVVILSHDLWRRRFAADPAVVGRTLAVNERVVTVVGVAGEGFRGMSLEADLWAPLAMIGLVGSPALLEARGSRFLPVVGRLAPGATAPGAEAELDAVARELQALYPETHEDRFAQVRPVRDAYLGSTGTVLWVLFAGAALLLTVAAANVANLLLARAHARTGELTVRRALGASGGRIGAQLLTESLVLAFLGGALGLALSVVGLRVLTGAMPLGVLPAYATPELSGRVFAYTLCALALVGLGAGIVPAVRSGRETVAEGLRSARVVSGGTAQRFFVTTQVALALVLLIGAGLLGRSFRAQLGVDPGLEMEGVRVFRVQLPTARYPDGGALSVFTDELLRAIAALPGVSGVAASSDFPFRDRSSGAFVAREEDPATPIRVHRHAVSPGYFRTLGVELRAGRLLEEADDGGASRAAVVTQAFVDRVFPGGGSGVGRTFWTGDPSNPDNRVEVVGVVENVRYRDLIQDPMAEANSPDVFFALRQMPSRTLEVSYRLSGGEEGSGAAGGPSIGAIRDVVRAVDSEVPVFEEESLRDAYLRQTATPRFAALLMSLFGGLSLVLACVGVYGVLAFTVGRRRREMALRRALGARALDVGRTVVGEGVRMAAVGIVLGGLGALLAARTLESLLFQVRPGDPVSFAAGAAMTLAVAVLAAVVPAWRAAQRSPAEVLADD